jgi:chemotaxis protein histidine kinase CheA
MPHDKTDKPSVATYADYEIITPANKLRRVLTQIRPDEAGDDPVARAEQALAQLAGEFAGWMDAECERLDQARLAVKTQGFTKATCEALFLAAHDIKGEAVTFGFPWVSGTADSLCRLIEHTPDMTRIPVALVDQHVNAVRAIMRESAHGDITQKAHMLTEKLRQVTDEFLSHENRDYPDAIDDILAPPLLPEQF